MKQALAALFMLALIAARGYGDGDAPSAPTLRVLTYNIHHGEGTDGVFDLPRIAGVVKAARPDLVALQEVDERTTRVQGVDQLDELGRLTALHTTFGKAMAFSGGDYGVAVLSRWPILSADNEPLPSSADREPRTALTVRVRAGERGPVVQFTCTHLDQGRDEQDRLEQAAFLNATEAHDGIPAILAGDMNSRPDTVVMKTLETEWTDAAAAADPALLNALSLTVPAARIRYRPDYVLYRPASSWRVIESSVIDETVASDHRPVLAVLEWAGPR